MALGGPDMRVRGVQGRSSGGDGGGAGWRWRAVAGSGGGDQGDCTHTLGCPAWPEVARGGAATVAAAVTAAVPAAGSNSG